MQDKSVGGLISSIKDVLNHHEDISFAYLFGSQLTQTTDTFSDIDIAIYLEGDFDKYELFDRRLSILGNLNIALKTDNIDLILLNEYTDKLKLCYNIICDGIY